MATLVLGSGRKVEFDPTQSLIEWPSDARGAKPILPTPAAAPQPTSTLVAPGPTVQAFGNYGGSGQPYESASTGRRNWGWQPNRLGPTTNLWTSLDLMRARSRDSVRNNAWAASAVDNFEAQIIGNGMRPHWSFDNDDFPAGLGDPEKLKKQIESAFNRWARSASVDYDGLCDFYGMQALVSREIFAAGEVLARKYVRPDSWKLPTGIQFRLIQGEQMPVWRNIITGGNSSGTLGIPAGNSIRVGIEFDQYGRRAAYHMYKENPGETMFFPLEALVFTRIPADEILHCYKPLQAGQLRGQPFMAPVLGLLRELEQYTDAALVKKKIQTFFAAFIEKTDPYSQILPNSPTPGASNGPGAAPPPGVEDVHLETGSVQNLFPGEKITFPTLPTENDFESFMKIQLHKFAAGIGITYEQLSGDLKDVTFSSIRAGLNDFRRRAEQFQRNIIITQFCQPAVEMWLDEAVLSGVVKLPQYSKYREFYTDVRWSTPGWPWVDPLKDMQASQLAVRSGFNSRQSVVAESGDDSVVIDQQQQQDNKRADEMGLLYESDARQVLTRGEALSEDTGTDDTGAPSNSSEKDGAAAAPSSPAKPPTPAKTTPTKPATPAQKQARAAYLKWQLAMIHAMEEDE